MRITPTRHATAIATAAAAWLAASHALAAPPKQDYCARPAAGSVIQPPPDLYSVAGKLDLALDYRTALDADNRTLFCFVTPGGIQSPTLHVQPGDTLTIALTNKTPHFPSNAAIEPMVEAAADTRCGAASMQPGSVNMHFHGLNIAPTCHGDEVIHTLVNPGETFTYTIRIPKDEPPGLYWYHPHVHGIASAALLGGASGAIVVDGIETVQPAVASLPARILILRDQTLSPAAATAPPGKRAPSQDVSLNYVPITFPTLLPAKLVVQPGRREFWRVLNADADTIADLVLKYDGVPQTVSIVAQDGVATGSQDGSRHGRLLQVSDVAIPPAGRAEFIIPAIPVGTKRVSLETLPIATGPAGDADIGRPLAIGIPGDEDSQAASMPSMPAMEAGTRPAAQRFEGLDRVKVSATRHLILNEFTTDPGDPNDGLFFITVQGQIPQLFNPDAPPAITTTQGAVEDWVIENQTTELHEFHIHQIHFELREINGWPVSIADRQFRDTIPVPYWTGHGPYPTIKLRMDFRGAVVGDFVYHCHILDHEDRGMMAIIHVQAKGVASQAALPQAQ